jgi:hypothetical protein
MSASDATSHGGFWESEDYEGKGGNVKRMRILIATKFTSDMGIVLAKANSGGVEEADEKIKRRIER